jgi:hypothetical protein
LRGAYGYLYTRISYHSAKGRYAARMPQDVAHKLVYHKSAIVYFVLRDGIFFQMPTKYLRGIL